MTGATGEKAVVENSGGELLADGQEEVFSYTAVERGVVEDPPAIGPVERVTARQGLNGHDELDSVSGDNRLSQHMAGTHFDDQAERLTGTAPEDFPRGTGLGDVHPDAPPRDQVSSDPEANILPTDSPGG